MTQGTRAYVTSFLLPFAQWVCNGGRSIFLKGKAHPCPRVSLTQGRLFQLKRTQRDVAENSLGWGSVLLGGVSVPY